MAKKRVGRYSNEFRRMVVERLTHCDNVVALAQERGVHRQRRYGGRDRREVAKIGEGPPDPSRDTTFRKEIR